MYIFYWYTFSNWKGIFIGTKSPRLSWSNNIMSSVFSKRSFGHFILVLWKCSFYFFPSMAWQAFQSTTRSSSQPLSKWWWQPFLNNGTWLPSSFCITIWIVSFIMLFYFSIGTSSRNGFIVVVIFFNIQKIRIYLWRNKTWRFIFSVFSYFSYMHSFLIEKNNYHLSYFKNVYIL